MEQINPVVITPKSPQYYTLTGIRYRGEDYQKLLGFPDGNSFRDGVFFFKSSYANIEYIMKNWVQIKWIGEAANKTDQWQKFIIQEATNKAQKDNILNETPIDMGDLVSKTKPFDHQLHAFNLSKNRTEFGLLFEQGCGKTKVIIDNARYLFDRNKIECLIVIAPNGVHDNWVDDELPIHLAGEYQAVAWRSNFTKAKKAAWDKVKEADCLKIFTFNVECFVSQKGKNEIEYLLERFKCMLAIDESQKIKVPSAKRTKYIVNKIGLKGVYRRILTGTPVTRGSEDFYSQLKFLNPNILGITAFSGFKNRYCTMGGWENRMIVGYKNIEELQDKVDKYSMRVLKQDCLDLPDKLYNFVNFDLSRVQVEMIKKINKEGIAEIKDMDGNITDEIILKYVMSRMTKIQQISNGYLYDTENKKVIEIVPPNKNPRLLELKRILENTEGKTTIWCKYKEDVKLITGIMPVGSYRTYEGSVSQDDRKENKKAFMEDDKIRNLILNIKTGATGLTLTVASNVIYFSNEYSLELRLQSEDRSHRIGTKENVLYTDLVANNTMDKKIIKVLRERKSISELILKDPAGFFLEER